MCNKDIRVNEIGEFIKSLNSVEYNYLCNIIDFKNGLLNLLHKYKLSVEQICSIFSIKEEQYEDFVGGNYDYSLQDISRLRAAHIKYDNESENQH